jgi:hypothetical protein
VGASLITAQERQPSTTESRLLAPETKTVLLEAPKPKQTHTGRNVFISNAIMFGASFVEANAAAYGSKQCHQEPNVIKHPAWFGHFGGGLPHPYKHDLYVSLPFDAGVTLVSLWLHKKHHDTLTVLFPVSSASAQFSLAGIKYGAGCF